MKKKWIIIPVAALLAVALGIALWYYYQPQPLVELELAYETNYIEADGERYAWGKKLQVCHVAVGEEYEHLELDEDTSAALLELLAQYQYRRTVFPQSRGSYQLTPELVEIHLNYWRDENGYTESPTILLYPDEQTYRPNWGNDNRPKAVIVVGGAEWGFQIINGEELYQKVWELLKE